MEVFGDIVFLFPRTNFPLKLLSFFLNHQEMVMTEVRSLVHLSHGAFPPPRIALFNGVPDNPNQSLFPICPFSEPLK